MKRQRFATLSTVVVPSGAMVFATQLGWVKSGSASRNSYEMFRSAQRLGLDELTPFRVVWFLLPVLCLGAVMMVGLARHHVGAAFLAAASIVSVGVGLAVAASGLGAGPGAPLATGAGVIGIVGVVALIVVGRRSDDEAPARPGVAE